MRCPKCSKWYLMMLNRQGCPYCIQDALKNVRTVIARRRQIYPQPHYVHDACAGTPPTGYEPLNTMGYPSTGDGGGSYQAFSGGGGEFSGAGASGNYDSSPSCGSSNYDSGSSSYDSGSSSGSDSGSCSSGSDY